MHPLVGLAKKKYYLKSHQNVRILIPDGKETKEFYDRAEQLVRNISEYPHAMLLGSLMDTNVDANVAWTIPYKVYQACGTFDIDLLYKIPLIQFETWFSGSPSWHRYPKEKAKVFYNAVQRIVDDKKLQGDASRLWKDKPSSQDFITRLLEFNGCGFKIANMVPNLLLRYYGIEIRDYEYVDIAPDVHTVRVFGRLGLVPVVNNDEVKKIYTIIKARELNKEFPGVVDGLCWEVGKYFCRPMNPKCAECPLNSFCIYDEASLREEPIISDKNKIVQAGISAGFSLEDLKDEFTEYQLLKGRNPDRIKEDRSWAFAHYKNNIGIGFWDSFKNNNSLEKCRKCFENVALNGGFTGRGVKDPKGYASTYIVSIKRLKEFFDEKYGGVDNYMSLYKI